MVCVPYTEQVEKKYTVCVPYTEQVEKKYTVCVPYTETQERKYTVCVPKWETKQEKYTVCVPYTEEVKSTRKVTKCVPETTTKKVKVCGGHWESQTKEVSGGCGCDDCCKHTVCCRVWVPEESEKEVACTTRGDRRVPHHTVCKTRKKSGPQSRLPHGKGRADLQVNVCKTAKNDLE
jgi:hypothetical protein